MGIIEDLQKILSSRYGRDVRQAIHDSISDINDIAENAESKAITAQDSAAQSAINASTSATNAESSAVRANEAADRAERFTPEGYEELKADVESLHDPATTEKTGLVKADGTSITVDADGTIHGNGGYELPVATTETLGGVKPDGETTFVDANGILRSIGGSGSGIVELTQAEYDALPEEQKAHGAYYINDAESYTTAELHNEIEQVKSNLSDVSAVAIGKADSVYPVGLPNGECYITGNGNTGIILNGFVGGPYLGYIFTNFSSYTSLQNIVLASGKSVTAEFVERGKIKITCPSGSSIGFIAKGVYPVSFIKA